MTKQNLKILLIIFLLLPTIGCFGSLKKAFIFPEKTLFWAASPDGEKIVYYSSEGNVYLKKINSQNQPKLVFEDFLGSEYSPTDVVWSPDSNKVFIGKANLETQWYLYDVITEKVIANYQGFPAIWSPNSKTYVWGVVNENSVKYYLSDTKNEIQPKRLKVKYDLAPIEFSPDGEKLLVDFRTENDLISGFIDLKSFELKIIGQSSTVAAWSANGEYVVYNVVDGNNEGLWIMETKGERRSKISELSGNHFVWSPDNSKIAFLERGLHIADIKEKSLSSFSKRTMPETEVGFGENSQKWSSDGKYLYAMYEESRYFFGENLTILVKLDSKGKIISKKVLKGHPDLSLDVHWTNDGKKLLYRSKEEDNTIYEMKVE